MKKRDIKFRAWDTENKEFVPLRSLVFDIGEEPETYGQIMDVVIATDILWHITPQKIVLQQFTGLVDKNGNEIYEGDVFEFGESKIRCEVFYSQKGESDHEERYAMFCLKVNDEKYFPFEDYALEFGKVIGNIYETPELLTHGKEL